MRKAIFYFLALCSTALSAQGPINLNLLKKEAQNKNSALYYPQLLKRWQARDSSLNMQECQMLYYAEKPAEIGEWKNVFLRLKTQAEKPKLNADELKKALDETDAYLLVHPFDLEMMEFQIHFLHLYGVAELRKRCMVLQGKITQVVLASGNGKSCPEALLVNKIQDNDYWLSLLDLEMINTSTQDDCLKIELKPNKNGLKYLFLKLF